MSDDELKEAWSTNFSLRRVDPTAESICCLICEIISVRARVSELEGSMPDKVRRICLAIGIREEEYEAVTMPLADN